MRRDHAGNDGEPAVAELRERLRELLQNEFPGAELRWETDDRLAGVIIWDGFRGVAQSARQRQVWKVLRNRLEIDDQARVLAILTVTPAEQRVMEREIA